MTIYGVWRLIAIPGDSLLAMSVVGRSVNIAISTIALLYELSLFMAISTIALSL